MKLAFYGTIELTMNIAITELLRSGVSEEGIAWYVYCLENGSNAVFWGSAEEGTRNIDSLKGQKLPCTIELSSPEECIPSDYVASKHEVSISIPEHSYIQVLPEF